MKIGIDARPLSKPLPNGIVVYLREILRHFPEAATAAGSGNTFYLYSHRDFSAEGLPPSFVKRVAKTALPGSIWSQLSLPGILNGDAPDVFWGTVHSLPVRRPAGMRTVLTVHDMVFRKYPGTMQFHTALAQSLIASL